MMNNCKVNIFSLSNCIIYFNLNLLRFVFIFFSVTSVRSVVKFLRFWDFYDCIRCLYLGCRKRGFERMEAISAIKIKMM